MNAQAAAIATPKKTGEIERDDDRVARPGDEARHARAEAGRRRWAEQDRRKRADADAREERRSPTAAASPRAGPSTKRSTPASR